jgi:hypothetical protein
MERLERFYREHPEMKPRQFKGFFDELWRTTVGGSLNVGAGLMGTLSSVSQDALWDKDQIEDWSEKLYGVSRRGAFMPAEEPGVSGFVASSVGQAAPFMGASIAATILTGTPTAAFGVAYAVEGDNAYRDALAAGAAEEQAQMDRFIVGTINGAIEHLQIRGILNFAETGEAGLRSLIRAARKRAWQKVGEQGVKLSYERTTHAIAEGLEEALQETTAIVTVTKYEPIPLGEAVAQVGRAGLGGSVMGLVYGTGGRLIQNLRERGLELEFETTRDNLADLIAADTGLKEEAAQQIATDAIAEKFYPTERPPQEEPTPFIQEIFALERPAGAKEPWQMTKGEFDENAQLIHGTDTKGAEAIEEGRFDAKHQVFKFEEEGLFALTPKTPKLAKTYAEQRARATGEKAVIVYGMLREGARVIWRDNANIIVKEPSDFITHRQFIRQALSEGQPIPRAVLEEYKDEAWAEQALAQKPTPPAPEGEVARTPEQIWQEIQKNRDEMQVLVNETGKTPLQLKQESHPEYLPLREKDIALLKEYETSRKRALSEAAPPPAAKEPWEMGREEYRRQQVPELRKEFLMRTPEAEADARHLMEVRAALSEGRPVPRHVLEEYKSEPWAQEALKERPPERKPTLTEQAIEKMIPPEEVPTVEPDFIQRKRAELKALQDVRFKTAHDELNIERIQKQLKENVDKWQAGQGVGWRVVKGQVNRGLRILEVYPETHEAKIQFVADTGELADIQIGRTHVVDTIDLIRDKKFDAPAEEISGLTREIAESPAYQEGRLAARQWGDKPGTAPNPYEEGTREWGYWNRGWNDEAPAPGAEVEKPAEVAEEPEILDLSDKTRKRQISRVEKQITKHELYQLGLTAAEAMRREVDVGLYYVDPQFRGEVEGVTGKPGRKGYKASVRKCFTFEKTKGAISWDVAAAERGLEITDVTEFVHLVERAVEAKKRAGAINEYALQNAIASGEPYFELLAMKWQMLNDGFSAAEINDNIKEQARHYGISEQDIAGELVPVERVEYVEEKPRVAEEVARKGRKAKAEAATEQAAIQRATKIAHKTKEPVYVYGKADKFTVSKQPPKKGRYTKVVAPKAGEVRPTITQETAGVPSWVAELPPEMAEKRKKAIAQAHIIANQKGLISEKGKPKPNYRHLANAMTGKKSAAGMTIEELEHFISALNALTVGRDGVAKVPRSTDIITKELADKIPEYGEIGFLEHFREARRVFQKMGLEKEVFWPSQEAATNVAQEIIDFRNEANERIKQVGRGKAMARKLFRAIENPGSVKLTATEQGVIEWAKRFFDDWANRLELSDDERRTNYVTHIFEAELTEMFEQKRPIDTDLTRALEYITPETVFNPFLERRLGRTAGLREDLWAAMEAYHARALKKFYYEPLIQRIKVYEKFLPPNSARYLRDFIRRISGQPTLIDRQINETLRQAAGHIKNLPGGKPIARFLSRGNAAGIMSYHMTGVYYECWLGLRPLSAIKNLSQHGLILAETGPKAFGQALGTKGQQREDLLEHSIVLRGRSLGYLPGVDETFVQQLGDKRRKITTGLFRMADHANVADAYLAGYWEAKNLGLSDEFAFRRGDEVAADTQYLYNRLAGAQYRQTAPGRLLGVLTTWPSNWLELMTQWGTGKRSATYQEYEAQTGQKIMPESRLAKRKAVVIYLGLVSLAMLIHRRTKFKAMYYTGWTSIKSLHDIASGNLPGLDMPKIITGLVAGIMTGDMRLIKSNWKRLTNFIVIKREIVDVLTGEKDWLGLFFVLEKPKQPKRRVIRRKAVRRKRAG